MVVAPIWGLVDLSRTVPLNEQEDYIIKQHNTVTTLKGGMEARTYKR